MDEAVLGGAAVQRAKAAEKAAETQRALLAAEEEQMKGKRKLARRERDELKKERQGLEDRRREIADAAAYVNTLRKHVVQGGSAALLTVLVLIAVAALTYDVTCFKRSGGKDASDRPDSRGVVQVSSGRRDF